MAFVGPKQCSDLEGKWAQGGALTTAGQRAAFAMVSSLHPQRRGQRRGCRNVALGVSPSKVSCHSALTSGGCCDIPPDCT